MASRGVCDFGRFFDSEAGARRCLSAGGNYFKAEVVVCACHDRNDSNLPLRSVARIENDVGERMRGWKWVRRVI